MTKRKAIEAAITKATRDTNYKGLPPLGYAIGEYAYDLGLIAGAREAANALPAEGLIRAWETRRKLRAFANALAKEVRKPR